MNKATVALAVTLVVGFAASAAAQEDRPAGQPTQQTAEPPAAPTTAAPTETPTPPAAPAPEPPATAPTPSVSPQQVSAAVPQPPTTLSEPPTATEITQAEFERAIARPGFNPSCLRLVDAARGFANALAALNGERHTTYGTGFSVEVCSPANWIARRMAEARRQYQQLAWSDLHEQDRANVLHVLALPDRTTNLNVENGKSVAHVVLRHPDKNRRHTMIVQPLFKRSFGVEQQNNLGAKATLEGIDVAFPFHALASVRDEKGEFLITVVGESGEKNFKVKQKHLDDLGLR